VAYGKSLRLSVSRARLLKLTKNQIVDLVAEASHDAAIAWLDGAYGEWRREGMVVKAAGFVQRGRRGFVQARE